MHNVNFNVKLIGFAFSTALQNSKVPLFRQPPSISPGLDCSARVGMESDFLWGLWAMKRLSILGLVVAWGWAAPAAADWQDTRWGMSLADMEARVANVYRPKQIEVTGDPSKRHALNGAYTTGNYSFISKFYFDKNDTLVEVKLDLINREKCADLKESLVEIYGLFAVPNIREFGDGKWKDGASGNIISYNKSAKVFCSVTYSPIPQPGLIGGL